MISGRRTLTGRVVFHGFLLPYVGATNGAREDDNLVLDCDNGGGWVAQDGRLCSSRGGFREVGCEARRVK